MTFELLKAGLQKLIDENVNVAEAQQAIAEINEIKQRLGKYNDIWKDECYVLSADTVADLINIITYDEYGKLYVQAERIGHEVSFNSYEKVCRDRLGLEFAPLSVIQLGFDYVPDLYSDNEANDCHASDGTFEHMPEYCSPTDLRRMYTDNGLQILLDTIQPTLSQLLDATEGNPDAEPANAQLAVLSNLHETLISMIG